MTRKIPFNVIFASEEIPEYPASELNSHGPSVYGWRSVPNSKNDIKEIILRFQCPAKICRIQVLVHQYLIPEKIELWMNYSVKDVANTPSSQTYEYIGFISLSDNSKTNYKSRELQSVPVGPIFGTCLKLRFGSALQNELNQFNQVGLVAVNILGEPIIDENCFSEIDNCNKNKVLNDSIESICDDLSFSMYVDESISEIIRQMEIKKSTAVRDERFEYARKLKICMGVLRSAGERLGRYALAKRLAVQQEDFTTANLRKEQMEIYRKQVVEQLQVEILLEKNGFSAENDSVIDGYTPKPVLPVPPSLQDVASVLSDLSLNTTQSPRNSKKLPTQIVDGGKISENSFSAPVNTIKLMNSNGNPSDTPNSPQFNSKFGRSPNRESPISSSGSLRRRNKSAPRSSYEDYEERTIPALRQSQTNEFLRECQGTTIVENEYLRGRSKLNDRERRQASLPIVVFGLEMVELFYSRQFQDREEGLQRLRSILGGTNFVDMSLGVNKIARSSTLLLHRSIRDAVFSVFYQAAETVRSLFVEFIPNKVSSSEVSRCVDKLLPELLAKSGDPSARIHTLAQHTILSIASCSEVREQHLIGPALSRTVGSGTHPRLALSRMQMLEQLVLMQGISTDKQSGLTCRLLSECGCSGIQHPSDMVRKVAERVLIIVYKINPRIVRKQLPPDDDVTRRNLMYRQLFAEFDKIDFQRHRNTLENTKPVNYHAIETYSIPYTTLNSKLTMSSSEAQSPPPMTTKHVNMYESARSESTRRYSDNNVDCNVGNTNSDESTSIDSPYKNSSPIELRTKVSNIKSDNKMLIHQNPELGEQNDVNVGGSHSRNRFNKHGTQINQNLTQPTNSKLNTDHVPIQIQNYCSFCHWKYNNIDQLNRHYWKACPMLTKCPQCSQVLEVALLNSHLINECDANINYTACQKCKEAVHKEFYDSHHCTELRDGTVKCPLCHNDVSVEIKDGWKLHLLNSFGCSGNIKRRSKI